MERTIIHRILGRPYVLSILKARPHEIKRGDKEYVQYVINVPKKLVEVIQELDKANHDLDDLLGEEAGQPEPLFLTVLATPSPWHHLVDWDEMSARAYLQLPQEIRKELEALGLGPIAEKERVLIPARPEQLRELGLDPEKPLTLEDVIRALKNTLVRAPSTPTR